MSTNYQSNNNASYEGKITHVRTEFLGIQGLESIILGMEIDVPNLTNEKALTKKKVSFVWKPLLDNGKSTYGYGVVLHLLQHSEIQQLKRLQAEYMQKAGNRTFSQAETLRLIAGVGMLHEWLAEREVIVNYTRNRGDNGRIYEDYRPEVRSDLVEADTVFARILESRTVQRTNDELSDEVDA